MAPCRHGPLHVGGHRYWTGLCPGVSVGDGPLRLRHRGGLLAHELPLDLEKYEEVFANFDRMVFVGHTHLPCVITDDFKASSAAELDNTWIYPGKGRAIINVGSVGQPRDGDQRACYVLYDGTKVIWRRVAYDMEATLRKYKEVAELDVQLSDRLRLGR